MSAPIPAAAARRLEAAARALIPGLPDDTVMVPAPDSPRTTLFVTIGQDEHQRRAGAVSPAITSVAILDTLLTLPHGMPVPWMSLTETQCGDAAAAETAHKAVTSEHRGWGDTFAIEYTRLAVRPLTVHLALIPGHEPRTAVHAATRYAPFCTRAVLLTHPPRNQALLPEADFWGVGITHAPHPPADDASDNPDAPQVLVRPRPWKRMRHSSAGWLFEERVYQRYLTTQQVATQAA